jgi:Putative DNA-binding domain
MHLMDLDKVLHGQKNFGEMEDADIEQFLKARTFGAEHLNLEFKSQFPQRSSGKFDLREICKYIAGFSNEEGGIVIYGVSDDIKTTAATFPTYVQGLTKHPSTEDLSQWVRERIHPLVSSPAIRFFHVCDKRIAVLKIPPGVNKPYCYCEEWGRAVTYFKKTAGGITELSPDEIREFHRTHIIDQARRVLRSLERESKRGSALEPTSFQNHKSFILPKLENVTDYGLVRFCAWPSVAVDIPVDRLREFMEYHRYRFSETLRYSPNVDFFQNGVSVGYFPRSIRKDVKSTSRTTLYRDGMIAFDAQVDSFMEGTRALHTGWLCYELQRHLQLAKALLKDHGVSEIHVVSDFAYVEEFGIAMDLRWSEGHYTPHEAILREVELSAIYDHDGDKRNVVINVVRDIIDEVYRIFGFSGVGSPRLWDENGYLIYVRGLENQR